MSIPPDTPPPSPSRPRRARYYRIAGIALAITLVLVGWQFWWRSTPPAIPTIDLQGVDPQIAKAIETARHKVEEAPDSVAAWGELGLVLRAHDYGAEANECFAQAERLDTKDPRWPYQRGIVLLISDPDAGLACLRRASDLGGRVNSPTLVLAEVLISRGEFDEAQERLQRVLQADGNNPRAHYALARIAFLRGDLSTSLDHLAICIREAPWASAAHALLSEIYFARGEQKRAEEESAIANQLGPATEWPDEYLDEVARVRIGIEPRIAQAAEFLKQNRAEEAVEILERATRDYPDSFDVFLALGKANLRLQPADYQAAERAFRVAIRLRAGDPAAHFHLGIALEQQKQFQKAIAAYTEAVTLKPDYAFAHYNRGQCLLRMDDRSGARDAFAAAARVRPNFAEAHRELGALLAQDNQLSEALKHLEQASQLAPKDPKAKQLLEELRKKLSSRK